MYNHDLIDRYVYAVTRRLPQRSREDIDKELRGLVDDMLEERCGPNTVTDKDVRVVLTELGTPDELAAKYDPEGDRALIPPPYYRYYIRTMHIVMAAVVGSLLLSSVIAIFAGDYKGTPLNHILHWIANICSAVLPAFGAVTLVFAILSRKGVSIDSSDPLSSLPAVPQKNQRIPVGECVFSIIINAAMTAIMCFVPQIVSVLNYKDGAGLTKVVPMFDAPAVKGLWYVWAAIFAAALVRDIVKLMEGSFSRRVALVTVAADLISIALFAVGFLRSSIVNPQLIDLLQKELPANAEPFAVAMFSNLNVVLFGILTVALAIDIITACFKGGLFEKK
ncbi:MAG: hypothetical protein E7559_03380 [Ruminococcaceae bacterium]|nr:hypothetical protein [Oscillospiraceae bacterium]